MFFINFNVYDEDFLVVLCVGTKKSPPEKSSGERFDPLLSGRN